MIARSNEQMGLRLNYMDSITYHLFNVIIVMECCQQWTQLLVWLSLTVEIKDHQQLKTTKYQQIIVKTNDYEDQRSTANVRTKDQQLTTIETELNQILVKTKDQQQM